MSHLLQPRHHLCHWSVIPVLTRPSQLYSQRSRPSKTTFTTSNRCIQAQHNHSHINLTPHNGLHPLASPHLFNTQVCIHQMDYLYHTPFPTTHLAQADSAPPQATNQHQKQRSKMSYCWTHGAYYHPGSKCKNKAPGHQDSATFMNRRGGSTRNVRGASPAPSATQTFT